MTSPSENKAARDPSQARAALTLNRQFTPEPEPTTEMHQHKGIVITQTFISPVTGRNCATPQGWVYPWPDDYGGEAWNKSLADTREAIDFRIDRFNAGQLNPACAEFIAKNVSKEFLDFEGRGRFIREKEDRLIEQARQQREKEEADRKVKKLRDAAPHLLAAAQEALKFLSAPADTCLDGQPGYIGVCKKLREAIDLAITD